MARITSAKTSGNSALLASRRAPMTAAAHHVVEALEARRLLSIVPNATLYQEWLDAPADFKAAVAQLEAQYPNFRQRFESDLEILSGTFVGPVLQPTTVSSAAEQPALATAAKTPRHPKPVRHPKPPPRHRKPHHAHRDPPPPLTVTSAIYDWTHANHTLTFQFNADVSTTIASSGALTVQNLSTGNTISSSNITLNYDSINHIATFSIPWGQVADGSYQATLSSSIIHDTSGDHLAGDYVFTNNFFFVTGDVNHDGYNNFADLLTLSQNYGATGASYSQGDINYDGTVGFSDLLSQAQRYHETVNLPVPTGLTSPTQTPTTALLIWQAANSLTAPGDPVVSGYSIYRTLNGTTITPGTNVAATAFLDTGLTQQTTYSYQFRTTDAAGDISLPSHPPLSVSTPAPTSGSSGGTGGTGTTGGTGFDTTPPDPPSNLQVDTSVPASDNSITITWTASTAPDLRGYQITRKRTDDPNAADAMVVGGTTSTSFADTDLDPATSYDYTIAAFDTSDNTSAPATGSFRTAQDMTPPSAPLPEVIAQTSSSVTLFWQPSTDNVAVTRYEIDVTDEALSVNSTYTTSQTTYTVGDLTSGAPYDFKVIAFDAANNSSSSQAVVAQPSLQISNTSPDGNSLSALPGQYVPQGYQSYFYDNLIRAGRQIANTLGGSFGLGAAEWLDEGDIVIYNGNVGYLARDGTNWYAVGDTNSTFDSNDYLLGPSLWSYQGKQGKVAYRDNLGTGFWQQADPIFLDKDGDSTFHAADDPILYTGGTPLRDGDYGKKNGLLYLDTGNASKPLMWVDTYLFQQPTFQTDWSDLHAALNELATEFQDPSGPEGTPWSIGGIMDASGVGQVTTGGTVTIDANGQASISSDAEAVGAGDCVKIDGAWWPVQSFIYHTFAPGPRTEPLSIRNWTLIPPSGATANTPELAYARGTPTVDSPVFTEQFQELYTVLNTLSTAVPLNGGDAAGPLGLAAPPTDPIPLTSGMDYLNVVPDSDVDGIVQVPEDVSSFGTDTGSIHMEPQYGIPRTYLPLNSNAGLPDEGGYYRVPVHSYFVQGAFGTSLTDVGTLRADSTWTLPDQDPAGLSFGYSLDTRVRPNLFIDDEFNHVKRVEVVRPGGNVVVFDFPWDAGANQFSAIGTPTSWNGRDADRLYVLRDRTPNVPFPLATENDYLYIGEADARYVLQFPSGVQQYFGGTDGRLEEVTTPDGLASGVFVSSPGTSEQIFSVAYQIKLDFKLGQLSTIEYQSNALAGTEIQTNVAYKSGSLDVQSLTKISSGSIAGQISQFSFAVLNGSTVAWGADPAALIAGSASGPEVTRTGSYVPGSSSTASLQATAPNAGGSRTETLSYDVRGMLTADTVALVEPDGSSSSATTTYHYQSSSGTFPNGEPMWGALSEIDYADGTWAQFAYQPSTGLLSQVTTPLKSGSPGSANQNVLQYGYESDGWDSTTLAGYVEFVGPLVAQPIETTRSVGGSEVSAMLEENTTDSSGYPTTILRRTPNGQSPSWSTAIPWSVTQRLSVSSYSITGPHGSQWDKRTPTSVDFGSGWAGNTSAQVMQQLDRFGIPSSDTEDSIGSPAITDDSFGYELDAFGRPTATHLSGGYTESSSYSSSGVNSWFGPASTINSDGSTTAYTYTADGFVKSATTSWGTSLRTLKHEYAYDAAGNMVSDKVTGTDELGQSASLKTSYDFDALGRMTKKIENDGGTDATANRTTQWFYGFDGTYDTVQITPPHGTGTNVPYELKKYYLDGTLASDAQFDGSSPPVPLVSTTDDEGVVGPGVLLPDGQTADGNGNATDVNGNQITAGSTWTKVSTDGGANYTITYTNMLGQEYLVQESGPGTGATAGTTQANSYADRFTTFDQNGRPYKVTDFDGSKSFVIYDPLTGQPAATIQDLNGDGSYEPNLDRKSIEHQSAFTTNDGSPGGDDSQGLSDAGSSDFSTSDTLSNGEDYQQTDNGLTTDTRTSLPTGPGDWVTTITNPDQTTTVDTYTNGLLTQEQTKSVDGSPLSTVNNVYDPLGRLIKSTDWSGTTNYGYFQDGTPQFVQNPGQNPPTVNTIDPLTEQPTNITRPNNLHQVLTYNSLGLLASQSGSGLLAANFGYDLNNTGELNSLTTYTSGVLNGSGAQNTSWGIDLNTGLEKSKTFADGSQDTSLYNLSGDLAGLTLPGTSADTIGYNAAGEPTSQSLTDAVSGPVSSIVNQQDDSGRPVITTDTDNGKSFSTINAYTPLGDLQSQTFGSAGNSFVKYDYFQTGSNTPTTGSPDTLRTMTVTPAAGPSAATSYTYDPFTKKLNGINVNGTTFAITYLNDGTGNASTNWVSQVQAGNVTINFAPQSDSGGLLHTITATGANDATLYSGTYYYNLLNQRWDDVITRTNVDDAGNPQPPENDEFGYLYTGKDFLREVDDNIASTTLDLYTYDGAGNQTGTSLGTPNSLNQYSALTYNGRGDVTGDGTYTYGWDANDRLISVTPNAPGTGSYQVKFAYDSQDRWLTKDVYSYNTISQSWTFQYSRHAIWDGSNLVAELDGNNNLRTGYTWGPNGLLAVTDYTVSPAKTYAVVSDASGNVVELLDPVAGTVAASFHYDPWGNLTSAAGPAKNVCSFLGKGLYVHAELPWLVFAGHRVSNGKIWLSRDPSGESGGLNLYELFGNDPINYSDRTGDAPTEDQILTPYLNDALHAIDKDPSVLLTSGKYNIGSLLARTIFYDAWATASRAVHEAHVEARSAMSEQAGAAENPLAKAGFRAMQAGLYGSEALDYADITYSQAEATGLGSAFRSVAGVQAARPWLARGIGLLTAAKAADVGVRSLTPEGRDSLQAGDFVDLAAGLTGTWEMSGGRSGPMNPLNYRLNLAGEVVDGQVTFGANKFFRYAPRTGPSATYVHDKYVQDVLGRDAAIPQAFKTPWTEGNAGLRIYDGSRGIDPTTGTLFEGNTTDWENIEWEKFNFKRTQIATDAELLRRGLIKRVVWFGTKPLPDTGLASVLKAELNAAKIEYYVVNPK